MSKDRYGRHICTKDDPWTRHKAEQAIHPDAIHLYRYNDEGWDDAMDDGRRRCPHCGAECLGTSAPSGAYILPGFA